MPTFSTRRHQLLHHRRRIKTAMLRKRARRTRIASRRASRPHDRCQAQSINGSGSNAALSAKAKALLLAHTIRSIDRRGRCGVHVIGNTEPPDDSQPPSPVPTAARTRSISHQEFQAQNNLLFWSAIKRAGEGPPAPPPIAAEPRVLYRLQLVPPKPPGVARAESAAESAAAELFASDEGGGEDGAAASEPAASDATRRLEPPPRLRVLRAAVERKTLHSDDVLLSDETLVLDCGSELYLWSGRKAGGYLRWAARTLGKLLADAQSGGADGEIETFRESEGCEGALFGRCLPHGIGSGRRIRMRTRYARESRRHQASKPRLR